MKLIFLFLVLFLICLHKREMKIRIYDLRLMRRGPQLIDVTLEDTIKLIMNALDWVVKRVDAFGDFSSSLIGDFE
jgi:hypothetical protein